MGDDKAIPVRVAVRARPLVFKESCEGCQNVLHFVPGEPQVVVGRDKAYTFDYAFPCESSQEEIYKSAVSDRIEYLFKGYNVTVLAYGQTGSGKTYTMGTSFILSDSNGVQPQVGIIQRAVTDIFRGIEAHKSESEYLIKVSFLEVYKEEVFDLLQKSRETAIAIREEGDGIKIVGLTEQLVTSEHDTLRALEHGSLSRTTASTAMNARSSRSHAIFTIILEQRGLNNSSDLTRAKFHLVDLAGSERANKTGTMGVRFREGVNINQGLLCLGNVISALCDNASHVPYRNSKLTRLLQDSLGGNSHTVMIACISPADSNLVETVNTLRYADRARKIKNKPIVNRDPQNAELMKLRAQVQQLQIQLLQGQTVGGIIKELSAEDKQKMGEDVKILLERNKHLEMENKRLAKELQHCLNQTTALAEKALMAEISKEKLLQKLEELQEHTNQTIDALVANDAGNEYLHAQLQLLREWQKKIIEIQSDQMQRDHEFSMYSPVKKDGSPSKTVLLGTPLKECADGSPSDTENTESGTEDNLHLKSTLKQAAMSRELEELERALALKEDLAFKMKESDSQMSVMRIHFENNLKQMEDEIAALQKEKEDLANALRAAQASTNATKPSEQSKKRLQELEMQITELKKQMQEKSKILKIKQDAERKVTVLQQEIQGMKSARVKLLRQIREESERYRALKLQKDREVAQLKQQDRKRQFEMTKLKQEFSKQKNVLKRKMEEASAANKRLNDALTQQRKVAERRMKEKQNSMQGIGTRVQQWLNQEIEVVLSSKEAQHHLQNLLDDRKTILEQLNLLKTSLESPEPPKKKKSLDPDDSESSTEERQETDDQIKQLEQEFDMRNVQINDLQQKILDADQDEKIKQRWETIQNMVEAKCAMKWLFQNIIGAKMDLFLQASNNKVQIDALDVQMSNCNMQMEGLLDTNEKLSEQFSELKINYEEQLAKLVRENEEKTIYLLKQLNSSNNANYSLGSEPALMERIKFQESEISRLSYLHEECQKKSAEIENLREQLILANCQGRKTKLFSGICDMQNTKSRKNTANVSLMGEFLDDDPSESSNDENDPDWRLTPLYKRNRLLCKRIQLENSSDSDNTRRAKNSSNSGCTCQGNCGTKRCGCAKQSRKCSKLCKCSITDCCNRDSSEESVSSDFDDSDAILNKTHVINNGSYIKVPAVLAEINDDSVKNKSDSDDFVIRHPKHVAEKLKKHKKAFEDGNSIIDGSGIKKNIFHNRSQKHFFGPVRN